MGLMSNGEIGLGKYDNATTNRTKVQNTIGGIRNYDRHRQASDQDNIPLCSAWFRFCSFLSENQ